MKLIVNADDFALNLSATNAICEAFKQSIITDTTMMANGEAFDEAVEVIPKYHMEDRIGIHFNLTEGQPLTEKMKSCARFVENGQFKGRVNRFKPLTAMERDAVYSELTGQLNRITAAGIAVSHADSHHHIHTAICISRIFMQVCQENNIKKVRAHRNFGNIPAYKQIGKMLYNRWLQKNGFILTNYFGSLEDLENVGCPDAITEIMVHPDFDVDKVLIDRTEMDPYPAGKPLRAIKQYLNNNDLFSYKEL